NSKVVDRVDNAPDVMVGILQESGVDLHLSREHRPQSLFSLRPRRNFFRSRSELALGRNDAELLLVVERLLAERVPSCVKTSLVLRAPLRRNLMRRVCG